MPAQICAGFFYTHKAKLTYLVYYASVIKMKSEKFPNHKPGSYKYGSHAYKSAEGLDSIAETEPANQRAIEDLGITIEQKFDAVGEGEGEGEGEPPPGRGISHVRELR